MKTLNRPDVADSPEAMPALGAVSLLGHVKQDVSDILLAALNGSDSSLRYDNGQFIRWGLVEKRIHAAIEAKWPNS